VDNADVSVPESHTQIPWKFVWHANSLGEGTDMLLAELKSDSEGEVADIAAGQIQMTSATGLQGYVGVLPWGQVDVVEKVGDYGN
jgi:hypothetical protein